METFHNGAPCWISKKKLEAQSEIEESFGNLVIEPVFDPNLGVSRAVFPKNDVLGREARCGVPARKEFDVPSRAGLKARELAVGERLQPHVQEHSIGSSYTVGRGRNGGRTRRHGVGVLSFSGSLLVSVPKIDDSLPADGLRSGEKAERARKATRRCPASLRRGKIRCRYPASEAVQ